MFHWLALCFQAMSVFRILIFTRFTVNIDFSFVHTQFVQVKHARNPLFSRADLPLCRHSRCQQISGEDDAREAALSNPQFLFEHACKSFGKNCEHHVRILDLNLVG